MHGRIILTGMSDKPKTVEPAASDHEPAPAKPKDKPTAKPEEFGGPPGPEPTRYGDWERGGRCVDF
jgi:hypothetical protein